MYLQSSDQKTKLYLFLENDLIRIGDVFFSVKKLEQKHAKPIITLSKFYTPQYIEKYVSQIENPQKKFRLENVLEYHFWLVEMTLQEKFLLDISGFNIDLRCKLHPIFCQNSFWKIKFLNLKHLSLANSQIFSLEGLSHCILPVLQKLELHKNKITKLSILSKLSLKNLRQISTYQNPLSELDSLKRLHAESIQFLEIDVKNQRRNNEMRINFHLKIKPIVQKIDFIVKTQFLYVISEFRLGFSDRILPKWYEKTLKDINKEMKYYTEIYLKKIRNQQIPLHNMIRVPRRLGGPMITIDFLNHNIIRQQNMEEEYF